MFSFSVALLLVLAFADNMSKRKTLCLPEIKWQFKLIIIPISCNILEIADDEFW